MGNHPKMPDTFHPHYFSGMSAVNTSINTGLLLSSVPSTAWLNVASCGTQNVTLPGGSR